MPLSGCLDKCSFKAEDSDRAHQAIYLLADRRKDCLPRPHPDSTGAFISLSFIPFFYFYFFLNLVCLLWCISLSLSFAIPSLFLILNPTKRLSHVKASPLWIFGYSALSRSVPLQKLPDCFHLSSEWIHTRTLACRLHYGFTRRSKAILH